MRRLATSLALLLALVLAGAGALTGPAAAQSDEGDRLVLRAVDAADRAAVNVVVSWSGEAGELDGLAVADGEARPEVAVSTLADSGLVHDLFVVVDTSASTDDDSLLVEARRALGDFFATIPAGTRMSLVRAGVSANIVQPLTDDPARLLAAVDDLAPAGESGLLGGITRAAATGARQPGALTTVVLITDGVSEPTVSGAQARTALADAGAILYVVGLRGPGLDEGSFASLAASSGGRLLATDDPTEIDDLLEGLTPELQQLAVATFSSDATRGIQDISVSAGEVSTAGSYVAGGSLEGPQRLAPRPTVDAGGIRFLQNDVAKYLAIAAATLAAAMFAYGVILLFVRQDGDLTAALRPYSEEFVASGEDEGIQPMAQSALLQRAVAMTESFARQRGVLVRVEKALEKAGLPLRAGEAMFFYLATALLVIVLLLALTQNLMATAVLGLFAVLIPPAILNFFAERKKKKFQALLPDTLQLLSSTLRAGYSMMQGVEAVSQEVSEPMGAELRRVVTEARLGRPLEESLEAIADRMDSPDFAWAVMAIRIQREVGGNLSELLLTVAETMVQRERLRRDISALTAEGRVSAYVLGALPIGLGAFLYMANPDYISTLFDTNVGQIMLAAAALMIGVGFAWMFKIIKIEI
ncbi:MAG: type II secretion system F family protein [Actinomycetota bacterium]|nr:type II secretion system F family protein [Acidimicrobiia bacterium]MDQ3293820.1 type II secretion system F family protein [Actinomycetota bacterium]